MHLLHKAMTKKEATVFKITWILNRIMKSKKASAALLKKSRKFGPFLKGKFAVSDGVRFKCQNYGDSNLQSTYYENYTLSEEVMNLFVFNFLQRNN